MPLPLAVPLALGAAGLGAQVIGGVMSAREQEKARREEIERQRNAARKAAIQRAIGVGFGPSGFKEPYEADLTTPAMISGLGRLATTIGAGL